MTALSFLSLTRNGIGRGSHLRMFSAHVNFPAKVKVQEGEKYSLEGQFTLPAVQAYTTLCGDSNSIHVDAAAARAVGFRECVVPGMLCAGLFPAIIGSRFAGAVYVSQTLEFKLPVTVGDCFFAEVEVIAVKKLKQRTKVTFRTQCIEKDSRSILVDGQAVALLPHVEIAT